MAGTWVGPDWVYAVTPEASGVLTLSLNTTCDDPILHVHLDCPGNKSNETACQYRTSAGVVGSSITVLAGVTYYVAVDSWNNSSGSFTLNLSLQ